MPSAPLTPYLRRLIVFLSVATFFEGYDFFALTQILPSLRADLGLDKADAGLLVGVINIGTMIAALVVRKADAWGRRRVLTVTLAGYTLCSLATALAPNAIAFGATQLAARVFLIAEWATAMVILAEEFPADRRGFVIGLVQACGSLGAIVCAVVVPPLVATSLRWRAVYLVGAIPLLIVAYARRGLRETERFAAQARPEPKPFMRLLEPTPYRRRMLQLGLIWGLAYVCTNNAITFWKEFAMGERGFTEAQVGTALAIASVVSLPLLFFAGKIIDSLGRRRGALIIFLSTSVSVALAYTLYSHVGLTIALVIGIFGTSAVLPVMNAYTTELFPTDLRGDAFAWSNNILGRIGYVGSPIVIGILAEDSGWGPVLAWTAVFPLLSLALIMWLLPETSGRELEDTSAAA
jgi:MFS transporter, putative metabolite:H+ symporter